MNKKKQLIIYFEVIINNLSDGRPRYDVKMHSQAWDIRS